VSPARLVAFAAAVALGLGAFAPSADAAGGRPSKADLASKRISLSVTDKAGRKDLKVTSSAPGVKPGKAVWLDKQADLASAKYVLSRAKPGTLTITYRVRGMVVEPGSQPPGHIVTQQFGTMLLGTKWVMLSNNYRNFVLYDTVSSQQGFGCSGTDTTAAPGGKVVTVEVSLDCIGSTLTKAAALQPFTRTIDGQRITTDLGPKTRVVPLTAR